MKQLLYIVLCFPMLLAAQIEPVTQDSTAVEYILVDGDSIPKTAIDLDEVLLLHKLKFTSKEDRITYLILKRKTLKVYPYAKLAADRLTTLNERLLTLESKRSQKKYAKIIQRYIEDEFSAELKKLTRTEGQILVKLIHRQTGKTTFGLIKELRSGWRAFWFNTTASMFDISLKEEFNPMDVKEDFLIEDILERAFQNRLLERQKPAISFDFYDLTDKWLRNKATVETKN
ncbi:DUF4294 domain-containing protein [Psychroserpens burtonensis]|uniref:DUF4294 domain-containing protein n=1 Tax=Psychroserpens burtonensis TaxID=49278 RepID=A0A5C7BF05_9FLAO|nr:DUF4294 domain-containing protein [Psychroserpens burtonensis]TXE19623.1 DUF4294 domain-containing protein [Psychroserpens burtonensis]